MCNCDKAPTVGTWGGELLELCRSTELLIINRQTSGEHTGVYTITSPQGQSVLDYFLMSAQHLSSVTDMRVMRDAQYCNFSCDMPHDNEKLDHFPLQLDLLCTINTLALIRSEQYEIPALAHMWYSCTTQLCGFTG